MNNIQIPPVVKNLLIINILFFAATWVFGTKGEHLEFYLGAFYFDSPLFSIWQPITYMFMHAGLTHILFNMFALYMFGSVLENRWGPKRFLNFYLITGLGALALQLLVQSIEVYNLTGSITNPGAVTVDLHEEMVSLNFPGVSQAALSTLKDIYITPMVGASGAIFGLLVAFGMLYPNVEMYIMFIPIPIKAKYIMPVYILIELSLGIAKFEGDSVAHYAHLGGALLGFILVKIWKDRDRNTYYDYYE